MSKRIICSGLIFKGLTVPSFEVSDDEMVGLVIPIDFGCEWYRLMKLLTIQSTGAMSTTRLIYPLFLDEDCASNTTQAIANYIINMGLTDQEASELISALNLRANDSVATLPLTQRMLLELTIAKYQSVNVVMMSTAGLDPLGIKNVVGIAGTLKKCAIVNIISSALLEYYLSIDDFSRFILCK